MKLNGFYSFICTRFETYAFYKWYIRQLPGDRAARLLAINHIVVDSLTRDDKRLLEEEADRLSYTFIVEHHPNLEAAGITLDAFIETFYSWKEEMKSKGYTVS